jgi:hypothetical protein
VGGFGRPYTKPAQKFEDHHHPLLDPTPRKSQPLKGPYTSLVMVRCNKKMHFKIIYSVNFIKNTYENYIFLKQILI